MVVRGPGEPVVDKERVMMIDDILLDGAGQLSFDGRGGNRIGNHLLVNGVRNPVVDVMPGSVERWRLICPANARYFQLAIPDHKFRVIGTDVGLVEKPWEVDTLLITPGERYDVLVEMNGEPGKEVSLLSKASQVGDTNVPNDLVIATLRYGNTPSAGPAKAPETSGHVPNIVVDANTPVVRKVLSFNRGPSINGERWPDVTIDKVPHNATQIWEIENDTDEDHPFHLHGISHQILNRVGRDGQVINEPHRALKDTTNVPPGEKMRFAVRFDGFAGRWMYHCHILEHGESMMGAVDVVE
jgi:bilirubin oxidase